MPAAPSGDAAVLDALAERYWQHWLERDNFLRAQIGLPIETIRPLTYANADADAALRRTFSTSCIESTPRRSITIAG